MEQEGRTDLIQVKEVVKRSSGMSKVWAAVLQLRTHRLATGICGCTGHS